MQFFVKWRESASILSNNWFFSDVNYLSTVAPPAAAEWTSLLRPLRGREPEGMWNLLSIVREMFKRNDRNAIPLLEIITEECLACEQILIWWFNTKVALLSGNSGYGGTISYFPNISDFVTILVFRKWRRKTQ